jgi:urease accessory protein
MPRMSTPLLSRVSRSLALLLLLPAVASAHPGHDASAVFTSGFAHPFSGVDHLLATVAVALWAAQLGGRARWIVPGSFLAAVIVGASVAGQGVVLPFASTMVLVSLLVTGICLFGVVRVPLAVAGGAVAAFALFHGAAHGGALPFGGSAWSFDAGFVLATALLQGVGLVLGHWALTYPAVVLRFCGGTLALGGVGLLLS